MTFFLSTKIRWSTMLVANFQDILKIFMKKILTICLLALFSHSLFAYERSLHNSTSTPAFTKEDQLCRGLYEQPTCGKTFYATLDNCEEFIDLQIIDNPASKEDLIRELLTLRQPLVVDFSEKELPDLASFYGFLFPPTTLDRVKLFFEKYEGKIITAYLDEELVGFLALTDASVFTELYHEPNYGSFDCTENLDTLEQDFLTKRIGYVTEIAVKTGYCKKGIGTSLLNAAKRLMPQGLVADIYLYPFANNASLSFFAKKKFREIGTLYLKHRDTLNALRTRVVYWTPDE